MPYTSIRNRLFNEPACLACSTSCVTNLLHTMALYAGQNEEAVSSR